MISIFLEGITDFVQYSSNSRIINNLEYMHVGSITHVHSRFYNIRVSSKTIY